MTNNNNQPYGLILQYYDPVQIYVQVQTATASRRPYLRSYVTKIEVSSRIIAVIVRRPGFTWSINIYNRLSQYISVRVR